MELGSQNVQELTGYIEEMFSEYMTFPTILFIVAIVVALSSIACFILAPFYIKGKARGAKTAAQVISVIDFIIGILLILAFIIITLLFNMASDGFFDSADEFLKAVLGFLIVPTRFGMSLEAVFGADANIGTPILFYALYFVTAGLLGLAAFIVSCIARGKFNAANGLIRGAAAPAGAPQYNPYQPYGQPNIPQGYPQQYGQNVPQGYLQQYGQNIPQGYPQQYQQNIPQSYPQQYQQNVPQGYPQQYGQNVPQGYPQQYGQNVPQGYPKQYQQNIPQENTQYQPVSQEVPQDNTQYQPVSQDIPQDNAQYQPVSQEVPQDNAQYQPVSQEVPQDNTQYQPVSQDIPKDNAQYQPVSQEVPQDNAQYQPVSQDIPQDNTQYQPVQQDIPQDNAQYQPVSQDVPQADTNTEVPVQAAVAQAAPVHQASPAFCGNCGTPVTPGASFCRNCGNKLN